MPTVRQFVESLRNAAGDSSGDKLGVNQILKILNEETKIVLSKFPQKVNQDITTEDDSYYHDFPTGWSRAVLTDIFVSDKMYTKKTWEDMKEYINVI